MTSRMSKHPRRCLGASLLVALLCSTAVAQTDPGDILSLQRISSTSGGFTGVLDDVDQFGISAAALGDLDGDGVADLAVGSRGDDDGGLDVGAVWILFLNDDGTVKAHHKISATSGDILGVLDSEDRFGAAVALLDDLDGDGIDDLAVGAPGDDDGGFDRGAVWLLFMDSDGTAKASVKINDSAFVGDLDDGDGFGSAIVALGNLDGDVDDELAVSAPGDDDGGFDHGAVWILSHEVGIPVATTKISDTAGGFTGVLDDGDHFGSSLDFAPGAGSGVGVLAAGAALDDDGGADPGAVWLLDLASDGTVLTHGKVSSTSGGFTGALDVSDRFGSSLAFLGDLDGDGCTDLAVGATADDDDPGPPLAYNHGAVWILFLEDDLAVKSHQKLSLTEGGFTDTADFDFTERLGQSTAFLGDLDGDGVGDLATGADLISDGGPSRGAVWVLFLNAGTWTDLGHALPGTPGAPLLRGASARWWATRSSRSP